MTGSHLDTASMDAETDDGSCPHRCRFPHSTSAARVGFVAHSLSEGSQLPAIRCGSTPVDVQPANGFGRSSRCEQGLVTAARADRSHWPGWASAGPATARLRTR